MKDLTITQQYMICALNEKGKMSEILGVEKIVCFVASGLLEMKLEGCIAMENKKVCVISELPEKLTHLKPLYDYINRYRSVKSEKIIEEYTYTFTDKRFFELVDSVGKSLTEINLAEEKEKGILGKRKYYIPTKEAVHYVIDMIRSELLEEGEITEDIVLLTILLAKGKIIKKYFSEYEQKEMKLRLNELLNSANGHIVQEMIDHIENMINTMTVLMVFYS